MVLRGLLVLSVALVAAVLFAITNTCNAGNYVCDPNCAGACNKFGNGSCDSSCKIYYGVVLYECKLCNASNCETACNSAGIGYCDGPNCTAHYGYNNVSKKCEPCDRNCTGNCTVGAGKCDGPCESGLSLYNYNCVACDPNCDMSASGCSKKGPGKCDSKCVIPYSWTNSTYTCIKCDVNCYGGCTAKGAGKCDSWCKTGYSLTTANYTCYPCDPYCISNCTQKGRGCCDTTCESNYTLDTTAYKNTYTCKVPIDGNWTDFFPISNCTVAGQLTRNLQRTCSNPAPYYNGLLCLNSSGLRSTVEGTTESCPCDPHCNSSCSTRGYLKCDSTCATGWGLNETDFTCRQAVSGGWGQSYPVSNCTAYGQLNRRLQRDCNNPAPSFGGALCVNSSGLPSTTDYSEEPCPCDPHCYNSSCTTKGYLRCDSSCVAGWGLNVTDYMCHESVNGSWGNWYSTQDCAAAGQPTHPAKRDCNNPAPAYGGLECVDSNGASALSENSTLPCPCDPNCNSNCTIKGYNKCDSSCVAGWGLNTTDNICYACNSSHCNGSCNIHGPGFCDGPCDPGFGLHRTFNVCRACDTNCATSGPKSGCNINGASMCDGGCKSGYAFRNTTLTCGKCDSNCLSECTQTGPGACDGVCKSGYAYDNSSYTCKGCDTNCASNCSVPYKCDSLCKPGYVLVSSVCRRCDVNCVNETGSCDIQKAYKCDSKCAPGYNLTATYTCGACGNNCNKTNGCSLSGPGFCDQCTNSCDPCVPGYGLGSTTVAGKLACYPCATNCNSGCSKEGIGCCDASCSIGTWQLVTSSNSSCHVCN